MKVIYKYELSEHRMTFSIPAHAEVLCVQVQRGMPCLWMLVDTYYGDVGAKDRTFVIEGTGNEFEGHNIKYIGTVQQGVYVWHVFEEL